MRMNKLVMLSSVLFVLLLATWAAWQGFPLVPTWVLAALWCFWIVIVWPMPRCKECDGTGTHHIKFLPGFEDMGICPVCHGSGYASRRRQARYAKQHDGGEADREETPDEADTK